MLNRRGFNQLACLSLLVGFSLEPPSIKDKKIHIIKIDVEYDLTPVFGIGQVALIEPFSTEIPLYTITIEFDDYSIEKYTTTHTSGWKEVNFQQENINEYIRIGKNNWYFKFDRNEKTLTILTYNKFTNTCFRKILYKLKPYEINRDN